MAQCPGGGEGPAEFGARDSEPSPEPQSSSPPTSHVHVLQHVLQHVHSYLWQARALGKLFEMPGDPQGTRTSYTDTVYYEDPADLDQGGDPGRVEFNFKRNPARNGHRKTSNSSKPAQTNTRTDNVASNVTNTHHKDAPSSSRPLKNHSLPRPNQCLHAFYYAWYGNPETDGRYMHWNHHYMPHWKSSITQQHPQGRHNPPDDIGASFYPELGCYSSNDVAVISAHMQQLQEAGVGVVAVSWYPAGLSDDEGPPPDPVIPVLLDAALDYGVDVTLHIEPYKGRTPQSVRDDLQYIHSHYSQHPAFYKLQRSGEASSKSPTTPTSVRLGSGRRCSSQVELSPCEAESMTALP